MNVDAAPEFVVACAGDGLVQRWSLDSGVPRLRQQLDCAGAVAPLAWHAEGATLYAALRGEPYALLRIERGADGALCVLDRRPLPADLAWIALDTTRTGLLGASYAMEQINWIREREVQVLPTHGPSHACVALGDGRLILATETLAGTLLCLPADVASAPLTARRGSRLRLHAAASPRHLAIAGDLVFVNNESHAWLDVCRYDAGANVLQPLFSAELNWSGSDAPWYGDIRCSDDGAQLWLSERRRNRVHGFDVDLERGRLLQTATLEVPAVPRALAHCGEWLVSCGERADSFIVHRRQPTGDWREVARAACAARPMWVEFLSGV